MDASFWPALFACVATVVVGLMNYKLAKTSAEKVKEVHDFVNNKDKINTETIENLTKKVDELQAEILRRADATPAIGQLQPVATPVTIESTKEPLPVVDVTEKK